MDQTSQYFTDILAVYLVSLAIKLIKDFGVFFWTKFTYDKVLHLIMNV